jgi:hypothetical protein
MFEMSYLLRMMPDRDSLLSIVSIFEDTRFTGELGMVT